MIFKTHCYNKLTDLSPGCIFTKTLPLILTFCLFLLYAILHNNLQLYQDYYCNGTRAVFYLSAILLCFLQCICLRSKNGIFYWLCLVCCITIGIAVEDCSLSPIDEGAHEAIIQYIIDNGRFPTFFDGNQFYYDPASDTEIQGAEPYYEAVQPPLYYLICSLIGRIIGNPHTRLIVLRLLGVLFLLCGIIFTVKTIFVLWPLPTQDLRLRVFQTLAILVGMPAVLIRFSHLSNDTLLFLWSSIITYLCVKLIVTGYSKSSHVLLGLVCGFAFITKNTSVFFVISILIVGIYYYRLKTTVLALICLAIVVAPWLWGNILVYGSLTSMTYHVQFVLPIVNPSNEPYDWVQIFFSSFWQCFWTPQEVTLNTFANVFSSFWAVCLTIWLLFLGAKTGRETISIIRNKFTFTYTKAERYNIITTLMGWLVLCSITILFLGCFSTNINGILGRYIHCLIPVLSILIPLTTLNVKLKTQNYLHILFAFFISMILSLTVTTYLWVCFPLKIQNQTLTISSVSDDNWDNGISRSGNVLLLDHEIFYDYESLNGKTVSIDDQSYYHVTNVENKGDYIWVVLDQAISNSEISENENRLLFIK